MFFIPIFCFAFPPLWPTVLSIQEENGGLFLVKTNGTCLRLFGFSGFEHCHPSFSALDTVVEFCPCLPPFHSSSFSSPPILPAITTKTNSLPKLIKFDDDSSEEEEEKRELAKNMEGGKAAATTTPTQTLTRTEMTKKDLAGRNEIGAMKCELADDGGVENAIGIPFWLIILAGILIGCIVFSLGGIAGFFIGKRVGKKEEGRRISALDHGIPMQSINPANGGGLAANPPADQRLPVRNAPPPPMGNMAVDKELPLIPPPNPPPVPQRIESIPSKEEEEEAIYDIPLY